MTTMETTRQDFQTMQDQNSGYKTKTNPTAIKRVNLKAQQ